MKKPQYTICNTKNDRKLEEKQLNKRKEIGVIIMDLCKAFDTLNHKLIVTKLKAYSLDFNAALFIKSYLINRY